MKKIRRIHRMTSDRSFYFINRVVMLAIFLIFAWPVWFIIIASISDPNLVSLGEVWILPKGFHLGGYQLVFDNKDVWIGYRNSILYTVLGTLINMVMTVCAAYPLSRMDFWPRKTLTVLFLATMYFGGGMIPTYLQVKSLGLVNTIWGMMLPGAVSIFNVLLLRSFFMYGVPKSLEEAANLDGANALQLLMRVYLPLVKPTLAVLVLYYAVGHWNDYFSALLYISKRELYPLQSFLRDILISGQIDMNIIGLDPEAVMNKIKVAGTLKYALVIVSTLPLMIIYPFVQKHFVKGVMMGAVKG